MPSLVRLLLLATSVATLVTFIFATFFTLPPLPLPTTGAVASLYSCGTCTPLSGMAILGL